MPAELLKECISELVDFVTAASRDTHDGVRWLATVESGSQACVLLPVADTDGESDECLDAINRGLKVIDGGLARAPFSDAAMGHYRALARAVKQDGSASKTTLTVVSPSISRADARHGIVEVAETVDASDTAITSFGAVRGVIKTLSCAHERYFNLYEDLTDRCVKVRYEDDALDALRSAYGRHVAVVGRVRYSRDGMPSDMDAYSIELDDDRRYGEHASLLDLRGVLAAGDAR